MGKKETQMSMKKVLEFEDAKSLPPVEQEEEEVETDISSSSFSTPRTVLTTDLFVAKADRFLRAGLNEAAARECVRGLDFKDDEHLRQKFEESVRRISTSLPSTDDCAATVFLELDCQETIIGESLALNVLVNFPSDDTRTPKDTWIGLFHAPSYIRRLLHDTDTHLSDLDIRSTPEVGQIARIPVSDQKKSRLVFPALASQQPAPPGIYEVRFYIKGNPIPLAVTDPLKSRWPIA